MLSIIQSFEMFPRHNGVAAISEHFTLNLRISVLLTNKYLFAPLYCKLIENLFLVTIKLSEYISSVLSVCLILVQDSYPKSKYIFSCWQSSLMNSYLLQTLWHFCLIQCQKMKTFHFSQIQFHIQNICTYQFRHF